MKITYLHDGDPPSDLRKQPSGDQEPTLASGRHGEHARGRGPNPPIPTRGQAQAAAERLLDEILKMANDDELASAPAPEDMLGILRLHRTFCEGTSPRDQVLRDRATLTRFIRDVLDREDHVTLTTMQRVRMKGKDQSSAFGWQAPTAARERRLALERKFSASSLTSSGEVQRASRSRSAESQSPANRRAQGLWIERHRERFMEVTDEVLELSRLLDSSPSNLAFLGDLAEEVAEADTVTGEWTFVILQLHAVVSATKASAHEAPHGSEILSKLMEADALLQELDQAAVFPDSR